MLRDLELPITRDLTCRIVERPGAWMSDERLAALLGELRSIARSTVRAGTLDYGVLTGRREALARAIVTVIHERRGGRPLAFSAMALLPVELAGRIQHVLHLGLALVRPDARGRRLSRSLYGVTVLAAFVKRGLRPMWVTNVSQVPSTIGSVASYFSAVYPGPGPDRRTGAHYAIARQIMRDHRDAFGVGADAEFDESRFVIRKAYTGGSDNLKKSYEEAAHHRRQSIEQLCRSQLDYARGDDFLQVGRYSALVVLRCLLRRLRLWSRA